MRPKRRDSIYEVRRIQKSIQVQKKNFFEIFVKKKIFLKKYVLECKNRFGAFFSKIENFLL